MRCEEVRPLVEVWHDRELESSRNAAVEKHVASCPECGALAESTRHTSGLLRQHARELAPPGLGLLLRDQLRAESAPAPAIIGASGWRDSLRRAAMLVLCCGVSAFAAWYFTASLGDRRELARDVTAAHIRALQTDNAVQVASSDRHTVKPWFAGRLDFAPEVRDLSHQGFNLVGGRVDYIGGRRVAALVYKRRHHTINVFSWPGADGTARISETLGASQSKGYNSVQWTSQGFTLWAISDLNLDELSGLRDLI